jgi:hypothetical protein
VAELINAALEGESFATICLIDFTQHLINFTEPTLKAKKYFFFQAEARNMILMSAFKMLCVSQIWPLKNSIC